MHETFELSRTVCSLVLSFLGRVWHKVAEFLDCCNWLRDKVNCSQNRNNAFVYVLIAAECMFYMVVNVYRTCW